MSNQAIGMIETRGYVPALASADAMVKAANVELVSKNEVGGGLVSVVIKGDVGSHFESFWGPILEQNLVPKRKRLFLKELKNERRKPVGWYLPTLLKRHSSKFLGLSPP